MTRQPGRRHRLTRAEIEQVRAVYARVRAARDERLSLQSALGLYKGEFWRVGRGERGKKPRREDEC